MPESMTKSERRRWERIPIPVPVFVRGMDREQRPFLEFATMTNINFGGALLITRRNLQRDSLVVLEVPCSQMTPSARQLQARLVHTSWGGRFHVAGLMFMEPLTVGEGSCSVAAATPA
jgi:hypothetical protein